MTADDVQRVTDVFARAFIDDPQLCFMLRQDRKKLPALREFFEVVIRRLTLPHGACFVTTDVSGAALWTPSNATDLSWVHQLPMLAAIARVASLHRIVRFLACAQTMETHRPKEAHHYLMFLGVDPPLHNRGLGKALLQPMLDAADRDRVPAYLETTKVSNVVFYEARGFAVRERIPLPFFGPTMITMWRTPR